MKYFISVFLIIITNIGLSQVSSFPYSESFETAFSTGTDISFNNNWTGNEVASNKRIFQGTDSRTGSSSLNIIPTSSFMGEILIALDLTGLSNTRVQFYAYSKKNGSASSTRPALLSLSTSINGGTDYIDNTSIGDNTTFPNDNTTSYGQYTYDIDASAANQSNVVVRISVERGSGSGSVAELIIDDLTIADQLTPLAISSSSSLSSTSVLITFNQEVTQTTSEATTNFAINNGITVNEANQTANNQVTLTTSTMPNNSYQVTVNNVEDAGSNSPSTNLQSDFTFITALVISSTKIVNEKTIELLFNLDLNVTSAEVTANYKINNDIGPPSSATLDKDNNKKVTLTLPKNLSNDTYLITVNAVTDVSTLTTAVDLIGSANYLPLEITSLSSLSNTQLQVTFNQAVQSNQANTITNYSIDFDYNNPSSVAQDGENAAVVILNYIRSFVNNTYELTVKNLSNVAENASANNLQSKFRNSAATENRQIVINEFFADPTGNNPPTPQVLPYGASDEYIELYNASSNAIDIGSFDISGGTIGVFVLKPNNYVILTAANNVTDFQLFGDVVAVNAWNTLTNGGEQITLKDNLGNLIDSLTYDSKWYNDEAKSDGAWSIEQRNPELSCSDSKNWTASTDLSGGTPGKKNAIYNTAPDILGPNLISVTHNSNQELTVTFDEIMEQSTLINGNYTLDNEIVISNVSISNMYAVHLTTDTPMTSGTVYQLTINGVSDCQGNPINQNILNYLYDIEAPQLQHFVLRDTVTIEALFDEEIEEASAKMASNYSINKSIGSPKSATLDEDDSTRIHLTFDKPLYLDTVYSLSFQNLKDTLDNSSDLLNTSFTFENNIDTVVLISNQLLDVYFDQNVSKISSENRLNYNVDRLIGAPITASLDNINHKLVHLIFDNAFAENSMQVIKFDNIASSDNSLLQLLNTSFIYDTDDPDIDSVAVIDDKHLQVYFDEKLDQTSAEAVNNYTVDKDIGNPSSIALQSDKSSVILTFPVSFQQELEHKLTITNIKDWSGNSITNNRNYNFIYDRLGPRLIGIKILNPTSIMVEFTEDLQRFVAENTANYIIDNDIGMPATATLSQENLNTVILTFESLGNNAINTLTISNLTDLLSNKLPLALTTAFNSNSTQFGSLEIISDTTLKFHFNKYLTSTSAETIENYEFNNGILINTLYQDEDDASIVRMNLKNALLKDVNYNIIAHNLIDIDGNTPSTISHEFQYDPLLKSISILNSSSILMSFEKDIDETAAETTSNYSINAGIGSPLTAVRNNTLNNEVTLLFNNPLASDSGYVLSIQNLIDVYGGLISASNNRINYDDSSPYIVEINSTYSNEIEVVFNEVIDPITAQSLNHYILSNGIGTPISATHSLLKPNAVLLQFASNLSDEVNYELAVERVEDLQGKPIDAITFNFFFKALLSPNFRDIIINEVYFDTDLGAGIPNIEYVELYNRSSKSFELRGMSFGDSRDTATFTSFELAPNAYLIVTSITGSNSFEGYGPKLGISNFPSLSNTGETIKILDYNNSIIDSLHFSISSYNDVTKEDGGFSIELINPEKSCFDISNYAASINEEGGTPGVINSIFNHLPDTISPMIDILQASSTTVLELTFSESMNTQSLIPENFLLEDGISVLTVDVLDEFGRSIILHLDKAFQKGTTNTLVLKNVADCSGNAHSNLPNYFFIGISPSYHDIIITEIMATPNPDDGLFQHEYIEIYNATTTIIELEGVQLSDDNGHTSLAPYAFHPNTYLILTSNNAVAGLNNYGDALGINNFPSFSITDRVKLANSAGEIVFEVNYEKSFYHDENKDEGGYSLEMINFKTLCFDKTNWAASINSSGGTPGQQNSVFDLSPDVVPPEIQSLEVITSQQLKITFNKSMDVSTIIQQHFFLSGGLTISNLDILDQFGRQLLINLNTAFNQGTAYSLNIIGLSDCSGNSLPTTNDSFYQGISPSFQDLIITEIMAKPSPAHGLPKGEYLEIYNRSDKIISLAGVALSDLSGVTELPEKSIAPGTYLILAPISVAALMINYGEVLGVPGWRALNSDEDNISLSHEGLLIFEVLYHDSWYRSSEKSDGGYSLEMIDTNYPCYEELNWIASEDSNGGTPGALNSVDKSNPDIIGPSLKEAVAISDNEIQLNFTEKLNIEQIDLDKFSLTPEIKINAITVESAKKSVILTTDLLQKNTIYDIQVNNISDCSGNLILSNASNISLTIPAIADSLDIVINEVLFNPISNGVRFVEIYNNSSNHINLKNWSLAGHNNQKLITIDNVIMRPMSYKVLSKDQAILKDIYPVADLSTFIVLNSMPNISSTLGSITLIDNLDQAIDHMNYSEAHHSILLDDFNGVSLERIDPNGNSKAPSNWYSASAAKNHATPGYVNSQFQSGETLKGDIAIQPVVFSPDGPGQPNFTTLNFTFDEPGNIINILIYDAKGNVVKEVTKNSLVSTSGFFRWDGTTERGIKARIGYYMILFEIISPKGKVTYKKEKIGIGRQF